MKKWHKSLLVGVGALVLSTVAIQASDLVRGIEGNLSGLAIESQGVCGEGSVQVLLGSHALCVDVYEASAGTSCPHRAPDSQLQTQENANVPDCKPTSQKNVMPWRFVSLTQAQQLCGRDGKRLPTNEEWYKIVSGFSDVSSCIISSGLQSPSNTGSASCMTPSGVSDMIGNAWEWMEGEVVSGMYNNRALPSDGYVSLVDSSGVVLETAADPKEEFGNDYALTSTEGVKGIIRGGFYGSGEDAGIFAQNLAVPLDFRSTGVGFRCVKDI
jgi:formylglycine-generating enzyme required for sulfatase activity